MKKNKVDWQNKKQLEKLCEKANCYSDVCRALDLVPSANIRTLRKYIEIHQIDVSHFDKLYNRTGISKKVPIEEILVEKSTYHRWHLKKRLIAENLFENKCSECGQDPFWNGKDLNMHLDHINGISDDNRIENLRLLCPNCHTQTLTYAGRNKGK